MATYGKAARRRIPEFSFASRSQKSQTPEVQGQPELLPTFTQAPPAASQKLKSPSRARSVPRTASPASPAKGDVFDVPSSEDEAPRIIRQRAKTPVKQQKVKAIRQRSVSRPAPSASPPSRDIFDVPEDEEIPKLVHKPVQKKNLLPSAIDRQKLKPSQPAPKSKTPSPPTPPKGDIFDVPSSGDEAEPTPKSVNKIRQIASTKTDFKPNHNEKALTKTVEDLGSRKRMKMTPEPEPLLKRLPTNTTIRPPKPKSSSFPRKNRQASPASSQFIKVVPSRPKPLPASPRRLELPSTPQKLSPAPQREPSTFSTPSPQMSDIDMMDVDPTGNTISPRGMKLWQGLLESAEATDEDMTEPIGKIDHIVGGRSRGGTPGAQRRTLSRPAGIQKSQKSPVKMPRRRLIDTLVEQATQEDSDEESEEEQEEDSAQSINVRAPSNELEEALAAFSRSQSVLPEPSQPAMVSESQNSQISGPKFTYSRQRSMLEEQDLMQELALGMPSQPAQPGGRRGRRGSIPALKPLTSFHEEEDEDSTIATVRNVHELRKAGANNRFLDEVQDYLERIGKPDNTKLSMRRSGLLDLASKMKDKDFAEKFRAHGMEMKLFMHLGLEQDIVAGYIMVSLLITVLIDGSIPHVIAQLRRQGITRLLIRLLDCQSSIAAITRDRKTNMSKVAQSLVAEHHDYLLMLPIWDELQPQIISPRTLALKCIERMVRQTREAGNASDIFSKELTTDLFAIMKAGSQGEWGNLPRDRLAIDFYLALSALESHSITARTVHDESIWISDYLPIIADILEIALSRPLDSFGQQQALILRLTLNVTNNNPKASDVFARPALLSVIGRTLVAKFRQISRFLTEDEFAVVMEHLVLTLGMMINLADRSSAVRESLQSLEGDINDPLDSMVQTFLDNQERTSMVSLKVSLLSPPY